MSMIPLIKKELLGTKKRLRKEMLYIDLLLDEYDNAMSDDSDTHPLLQIEASLMQTISDIDAFLEEH